MSHRYHSVFLSKMANRRIRAVEAVDRGLEDEVRITLPATHGYPATLVRLARWRSQEGREGIDWIRWTEVRDDLLRKYAEASGLSSWTFPKVPVALREALKAGLPRGADKEGASLIRVWQNNHNKADSALSKVALGFLFSRFDVDAPVVRAVLDALDRESSPQEMPLLHTAPRSAMAGARASARMATASVQATPR
jgi:hypothetical protein